MSDENKQEEQQVDKLMQDKIALRSSQAGMRFIAQMHIYNGGDFGRLDTFLRDSYHTDMLAEQSVPDRMMVLMQMHEKIGRMKVKQVVGTHEHQVAVVMEAENTDKFYFIEVRVEEDYPHKVTYFGLQVMREAENQDSDESE